MQDQDLNFCLVSIPILSTNLVAADTYTRSRWLLERICRCGEVGVHQYSDQCCGFDIWEQILIWAVATLLYVDAFEELFQVYGKHIQ